MKGIYTMNHVKFQALHKLILRNGIRINDKTTPADIIAKGKEQHDGIVGYYSPIEWKTYLAYYRVLYKQSDKDTDQIRMDMNEYMQKLDDYSLKYTLVLMADEVERRLHSDKEVA